MKLPNLIPLYAFATTVLALDPITVSEQEFVQANGQRFEIVGVAYQSGGQAAYGTGQGDPLSNETACLRDAALMQSLGVNTIRIYNLDPTLNHDACVSIFNAVGIYMILDVNAPLANESLDRTEPRSSYNIGYLTHIFTVVEAFKDYPNTLGFFAGNEIINDDTTAQANPPYIRAVQRDLKNYIASRSQRTIPVGYSAAQVQDVLHDTWAYLQCNNSDSGADLSRSDFFGLNSYSWCGSASSFDISGYNVLVEYFGNTTIPVFFSEYGCIKPLPRLFNEVPVLYGSQMTVLSGGLVYEWTEETDNYGLVQIFSNGSAQLRADYVALQVQYQKIDLILIATQNATATSLQPPKCNAALIQNSAFSSDFNIPDPPAGVAALIKNGVPKPPTGSLVSVTQTSVQIPVYNTAGAQMTPLAIKAVASADRPGGSGTSTTSSSKGLAAKPTSAPFGAPAVAAAVLGAAFAVL